MADHPHQTIFTYVCLSWASKPIEMNGACLPVQDLGVPEGNVNFRCLACDSRHANHALSALFMQKA